MDNRRSENMEAGIEKMPASKGTGSLVLGRDLSVMVVHSQVARRLKGMLSPLNSMPSGIGFLDEKTLRTTFLHSGGETLFFY